MSSYFQRESVVARRNRELEMYALVVPRIALLNDLHWARCPVPTSQPMRDRNPGRARREAQWPTWQMDRSWPQRSAARVNIECVSVGAARRKSLPWTLSAAGFVALGVAAAGLLAVGIERGLL
jgi:hypothetical protein